MGEAILDYGGSHVWQLPRQGVCELIIRALRGVPPPLSMPTTTMGRMTMTFKMRQVQVHKEKH